MRNFSKLLSTVILIGFATTASAQLIDEKDVSITLDMQPVLELEMTTPNQIEFVFDDITEYQAGITNYGATILKVSSTVNWDLYAVGRSNTGNRFWSQEVSYGSTSNSISDLPMSLLELRQSQVNANKLAGGDYSATFSPTGTVSATNSLFVNNDGSAAPPSAAGKYIAGHAGTTGTDDSMTAGTYLNNSGAGVTSSNFYYVMDYRILPGLPAIFPNASIDDGTAEDIVTTAAGTGNEYAEGGVYTMYVQYVLLEDQ